MNRVLAFTEMREFFTKDSNTRLQKLINLIDHGKMGWSFLEGMEKLAARLSGAKTGRTLLHLAVLDKRFPIIRTLALDPFLKHKQDGYGMTPVEIAKLLGCKESLELLGEQEVLNHPVFENRQTFESVLKMGAKAKKKGEIPPEKIWLGVYYDREISHAFQESVEVRFISDDIGHGVIAMQPIAPCAYVGEYVGRIEKTSERKLKGKKYCLRYPFGKKRYTIDAESSVHFSRYLNHSKRPNLGLQSVYWKGIARMIFVALRPIAKGEQLTFDYGDSYWKQLGQIPAPL